MHLDFAASNNKGKDQKFANMLNNSDMNMLKLGSPDLEKLIAHNGMVGTTPTPTQFIYPKYVTDEQEAYARGFVEALAELHQTPGMSGSGTSTTSTNSVSSVSDNHAHMAPRNASSTYSTLMPMSSSQPTFTAPYGGPVPTTAVNSASVSRRHPPFAVSGLAASNPMPQQTLPQHSMQVPSSAAYGSINVKSEPSTSSYSDHLVPHSPSASSRLTDSPGASDDDNYDHVENINRLDSIPVDLEEQEKIKLERKRARNRIAARKCRTRKLERIGRLEEKVADLKSRNNDLAQTAASLSDQVMQLKQQIMDHMKSGCQIMMPEMRSLPGGY